MGKFRDYVDSKVSRLLWIGGDAPLIWSIHSDKTWTSKYLWLKIFESLLRGFGQVCFANNPWSGLLILIALIIANPMVGLGSFVASLAALIMSKILKQPDSLVVSGLQNYSAVLVGSVTVSLFPIFFTEPMTPAVWGAIIVMGAFSVCIGLGLGNLLGIVNLPVYTLPFNVTTSLLFISLTTIGFASPSVTTSPEVNLNYTEIDQQIHWPKVLEGVLKSAGQVYAIEDNIGSIIILIALTINSPLLTIVSFLGSLLSTMVALLISSAPYSLVYAGVWGYNGFLAAGCIIFFVNPTPSCILIAFLNASFAAFIQVGLIPIFAVNNLPVFTFPFCLTSLLFLGLIEAVPGLTRVQNLSYPEKHFWKMRKPKEIKIQTISTTQIHEQSVNS